MIIGRDGASAGGWPSAAAFIALELAVLAAAHALGGPSWVAIGVLAVVAQVAADLRPGPLVGFVPALVWLGAHRLTGDRELFFPYAMALAVHVAGQFAGPTGNAGPGGRTGRGPGVAVAAGGAVVSAFLLIRRLQAASIRVLAVEAAVAATILVVAVAVLSRAGRRPRVTWAVTAAASLAAYAGLAL